MPALWDWVGKEEEGADRVERRERQRKRAHRCTLDTGEVMRGGNGHKRVWQIKAAPFVLLLCR